MFHSAKPPPKPTIYSLPLKTIIRCSSFNVQNMIGWLGNYKAGTKDTVKQGHI